MRILRRGLLISAAVAMLVAVPIAASQASTVGPRSAGSSLKLTGPKTNKMGAGFVYKISGTAKGAANFVVAWEQFYEQSGCAKTYAAESTRAFQPSYAVTLFLDEAVSHSFSTREDFYAEHSGKHGICAYLINLSTGDTYASAGAFWTNG
ncbi:MAG: hypothetical protein ABSD85_02465 [Acidimicrobiales bacterium]